MAIKWSAFSAGSAISGGDIVVGLQGGVNVKWTWSDVSTFVTPTTITVANEASDTTCFPAFFTAATGTLGPKSNASFTFNSSSGALGATSVNVGLGSLGASSILIGTSPTAGLYSANAGNLDVAANGAFIFRVSNGSGVTAEAGSAFNWSSTGGNPAASKDTGLSRVSAGVVGVGTGAQGSVAGSLQLLSATYGAGTTSVAPVNLTAGTNLTTAAAGAVEYDGKCFYHTAVASSRQVVGTEQFATVVTANALANDNTLQAVFASANDVLSLAAATTYFFEAFYFVNTGNTTHTTATAFTASSAFTSIQYWSELWSTTTDTISTTAPSVLDVAVSTAKVLNATSTATRTTIRIKGIIRTNSASTVTPGIQFSADPTGTCEIAPGSYFRIWPVGVNTVAAVGNWA